MGQILDKPVLDKTTHVGRNSYLRYGCSSMQGYRVSMEDRHNFFTELGNDCPIEIRNLKVDLSYFAVYDGHSGDVCADFLSHTLFKNILAEEATVPNLTAQSFLSSDERIKTAFLKTDAAFEREKPTDDSGSTAVTCSVKKMGDRLELICANTGDSRCILYDNGKTEPMSYDHKPTNPKEKERIINAGSTVEFSRVNGSLAVSRAFGDLSYKKAPNVKPEDQAVTALPEIKRVSLSKKGDDYSFLVLACDGIWDVMSNEDVTKFIRERLIKQKERKYTRYTSNNDSEFDEEPRDRKSVV